MLFPELRAAAWQWLADAGALLSTQPPKFQLSRRTLERSDDGLSWADELQLDPARMVRSAFNALMALPSAKAVFAIAKDDLQLARFIIDRAFPEDGFLDTSDPFKWLTEWHVFNQLLHPLCVEHWKRVKTFEANDAGFSQAFALLEQAISTPQDITFHYVQQFWNLKSATCSFELEAGVQLRAATEDEWDRTMAHAGPLGSPTAFTGNFPFEHSLGHILEITRKVGDFGSERTRQFIALSKRIAQALELGLRLLGSEWVKLKSAEAFSDNPFSPYLPNPEVHGDWPALSAPYLAGHDAYSVTPEVFRGMRSKWSQLSAALDDPHLKVPISRFNYAYERTDYTDRLIDYWIALEALFVPKTAKEDLVRVIGATIPLYLYDTHADREVIRPFVADSYDLRSKIVHGDESVYPWNGKAVHITGAKKRVLAPKTRDDLVETTEMWVRRSILKRVTEL